MTHIFVCSFWMEAYCWILATSDFGFWVVFMWQSNLVYLNQLRMKVVLNILNWSARSKWEPCTRMNSTNALYSQICLCVNKYISTVVYSKMYFHIWSFNDHIKKVLLFNTWFGNIWRSICVFMWNLPDTFVGEFGLCIPIYRKLGKCSDVWRVCRYLTQMFLSLPYFVNIFVLAFRFFNNIWLDVFYFYFLSLICVSALLSWQGISRAVMFLLITCVHACISQGNIPTHLCMIGKLFLNVKCMNDCKYT